MILEILFLLCSCELPLPMLPALVRRLALVSANLADRGLRILGNEKCHRFEGAVLLRNHSMYNTLEASPDRRPPRII